VYQRMQLCVGNVPNLLDYQPYERILPPWGDLLVVRIGLALNDYGHTTRS